MGVEFRGVEAADFGGAGLVFAGVLDAHAGFKDVGAGRQGVDEEVAGGVAGDFVITESILPAGAAPHVDRFGAAAAQVLEVHEFHRALVTQDEACDEFVADLERAGDRLELGPLRGVDSNIQSLFQGERCGVVRGHLGQILEVLPMHAGPRDAGVGFGQLDGAHFRFHGGADDAGLIEAGAGFDRIRFDGDSAEGYFEQRVAP